MQRLDEGDSDNEYVESPATSEPEGDLSDEDDAELLEQVFEGTYGSPFKFRKCLDPAE